MDRVVAAFESWVGADVVRHEEINCHLHRAGEALRQAGVALAQGRHLGAARRAGLIPGSMGTASYVVVGKGNPVALHSSPHGAGRAHSRAAARLMP